ncbi:MAG: creatininase family protein [Rhodothermia bacterium]|nr:creatininase family protein [Rhodothermia bacterium]
MAGPPYILAESNWKAVRETDFEVAVLPWGATEAHNYHLPYGTDNLQAEYIAREAARKAWERRAQVVVLPTLPFGVNTGQLDIKLCINLNPSTQAAVLRDIVATLDGQGIHKLVLLNGHGGNDFRAMIRELAPEFPDMFVSLIDWYRLGSPEEVFDEPGDHAGEMETSNVLHIAPDLVLPLDEAGAGRERRFRLGGLRDGTAWAPRQWTSVSDDTGVGNPRQATPEKGARHLEIVSNAIADYLVDLAGADLTDLYE